jgi:hypothetical protein
MHDWQPTDLTVDSNNARIHRSTMNPTSNDGEKMEKQMWEDIKAKNWKAVESKIADVFQSVHPDGARDRANEISLIKNLNVGQIEFNDFKDRWSPAPKSYR